MKKGDVDILISGIQADVFLPFPVKYRFNGLSFIFGKKGGIDLVNTYKESKLKALYKEINQLPVHDYDVVISDFEPVSSWACKINKKTCIGLSHQAAVSNKKSPKPKKIDPVGKFVLKYYAPVQFSYGFHFCKYDDNVFLPVIRDQIRNATVSNQKHYTVYLPAYSSERIIKILSQIENVKWQVFCKRTKEHNEVGNVQVFPIDNDKFIESFVSAEGVLCGAGFETPAEALYLNKKLMVIPMKGQFEQQCNAAALKEMGVPVIKSLKSKYISKIIHWISQSSSITVAYPNDTDSIIDNILNKHYYQVRKNKALSLKSNFTLKKLKEKTLGKILEKLSNASI